MKKKHRELQQERAQLWIILFIVFIAFMGTSVAYPIFPPIFLHPQTYAMIPVTWSLKLRSILLGLTLAVYPLGQFIGLPIIGGLSDRYGRKPLLLLCLIGSVLGYVLTALSLQWHSLGLLLWGRFFTGLMEGSLAIVRSMAADLKSISKYKSFGHINSMVSTGWIMGPLIGGVFSDAKLSSWFSFALPFLIAAVFSLLAIVLVYWRLPDSITNESKLSFWERAHLWRRFKFLFESNMSLKYLLLISTLFTFSVDMYYEFGPVYLTGLWALGPAGIALYNGILSVTLALGAAWLPQHLSRHFAMPMVIMVAMFVTAVIFGLMALFPSLIFVAILYFASGFSITTVTTNMTIQVADAADKSILGETLGVQLSLRTLGDALICILGGVLVIPSVIVPIALCALIALIAVVVYWGKIFKYNAQTL